MKNGLATLRNLRCLGGSIVMIVCIMSNGPALAARQPLRDFLGRRHDAVAAREHVGLLRDLADVRVLGDRPERHDLRRLAPVHWGFAPHATPDLVRVAVGRVALRIEELGSVGDRHRRHFRLRGKHLQAGAVLQRLRGSRPPNAGGWVPARCDRSRDGDQLDARPLHGWRIGGREQGGSPEISWQRAAWSA